MGPQDISTLALILCFLLLLIPLAISRVLKLNLTRNILFSAGRMGLQLLLMALFLKYLFRWNNNLVNCAWLFVMIIVATFSVVKNSNLNKKLFFLPVFISLLVTVLCYIVFFNVTVLRLDNLFDARYFIVIGGMMLGNSLRGNIIGISNFFKDLKRNEERYHYHIALGATTMEAVMPYFRDAMLSALKPTLASMATIGIVFIPGMMTGQILGGSTPMTAIKYQIAIMISIFVILNLAVLLTVRIALRPCFDEYGVLRPDVFRMKENNKSKSGKRTKK
jgi:putative ABC transport system permease protein